MDEKGYTNLLNCSSLLASILTKDRKKMDGSLENFKSKHKDVGFIDCTFKTTHVTLYNLTRDNFADTEGYNKLDFKILFWSI